MHFSKDSAPYWIATWACARPTNFCHLVVGLVVFVAFSILLAAMVSACTFFFHCSLVLPLASLFYSEVGFLQSFGSDPELYASLTTTWPAQAGFYLVAIVLALLHDRICGIATFEDISEEEDGGEGPAEEDGDKTVGDGRADATEDATRDAAS